MLLINIHSLTKFCCFFHSWFLYCTIYWQCIEEQLQYVSFLKRLLLLNDKMISKLHRNIKYSCTLWSTVLPIIKKVLNNPKWVTLGSTMFLFHVLTQMYLLGWYTRHFVNLIIWVIFLSPKLAMQLQCPLILQTWILINSAITLKFQGPTV